MGLVTVRGDRGWEKGGFGRRETIWVFLYSLGGEKGQGESWYDWGFGRLCGEQRVSLLISA